MFTPPLGIFVNFCFSGESIRYTIGVNDVSFELFALTTLEPEARSNSVCLLDEKNAYQNPNPNGMAVIKQVKTLIRAFTK